MSLLSDILKEVPLSTVLKEKIADLEAQNAALQTEIAILKDDLRQAQAESKRLKQEIESFTHSGLDEVSIKILTYLAQSGGLVEDSELEATLQLPATRVKYHAGQLEQQGYIEGQHFAGGELSLYSLTQKGREYAVKNNLI